MTGAVVLYLTQHFHWALMALYYVCPLILVNLVLYVFLHKTDKSPNINPKYQVSFDTDKENFKLDNIKRAPYIIGSAGSGKTESLVLRNRRLFIY